MPLYYILKDIKNRKEREEGHKRIDAPARVKETNKEGCPINFLPLLVSFARILISAHHVSPLHT